MERMKVFGWLILIMLMLIFVHVTGISKVFFKSEGFFCLKYLAKKTFKTVREILDKLHFRVFSNLCEVF